MTTRRTFRGFPPAGLEFLRDLKENNSREWFTPRKGVYEEQVLAPMVDLITAVHREMLRFAPDYVGEPKKCIYRIYRDTRFSKNKTPYKTNVAASMWRGSLGKVGAGFYFSISPEEIDIGGGLYHPEPDVLLMVRNYIAQNHESFRKSFNTPRVKKVAGELWGESAARAPKGFDPAHPAIDLIRRKDYLLLGSPESALAATSKLLPEIVKRFEVMTGFVEFLNRPLSASGRKTAL